MPFAHGLEYERDQMVGTISKRLRRNANWLKAPSTPLRDIFAPRREIGMPVRKFHDELGWMAKEAPKSKTMTLNAVVGLCSGSMYRSSSFLSIPQSERCGRKRNASGDPIQTVHIEHTVPATQIHRLFLAENFGQSVNAAGLAWLLARSIAAGVAQLSDRALIDLGGRGLTNCLTRDHEHYGLPFQRYSSLYENGGVIFDIWRKAPVDFSDFTIEDHFQNVIEVMHHCGAEGAFVEAIEAAGHQFR